MTRRKISRCVSFDPKTTYFKPQGIPLRLLEEVVIEKDELEAIKLYEVDNKSQIDAAKEMNISQPTFARILDSANKKIAHALIYGKAIKLQNNDHIQY